MNPKLDDGWPESVEEQSLLLLLVWRHYITRQYIKDVLQADEKSSIKTILYGIVSFASYLSKSFSRTELFTDRRFCTQTLLHTDAFTHRHFYTHTQTVLHTETFTHRRFYTQKLLHTDVFTHRRFYTHRNFTSVFGDPTSFRAKGTCERVARDKLKSQFYLSFCRSNLISCERVHRKHEIAILPQFLTIEPHFVRKGCAGRLEITILPQFLAIEPHFVRKGCAGQVEIAILPQFLPIEPHFVRKSSPETRNRNFTSVF